MYGFVKASGGAIRVSSQPGRGTTFEIDLPAADGPASALPNEHAAALRGGSETVLLVEDEPATREVVRRYLLNLGYTPHVAASPVEALERLRAGLRPHLLLTDVRMPGMQGPDLCRAARQMLPGLPAVFMSGFTDAFASDDEVAGAEPVLDKPFTREALAAALREALDAAETPRR